MLILVLVLIITLVIFIFVAVIILIILIAIHHHNHNSPFGVRSRGACVTRDHSAMTNHFRSEQPETERNITTYNYYAKKKKQL